MTVLPSTNTRKRTFFLPPFAFFLASAVAAAFFAGGLFGAAFLAAVACWVAPAWDEGAGCGLETTLGWTGGLFAPAADGATGRTLLMGTPSPPGATDVEAAVVGTGAGRLAAPPGRTGDSAVISPGGAGRANAEPAGTWAGGCFARDGGGAVLCGAAAFTTTGLAAAACGGGLASCGGGLAAGADVGASFLPTDGADAAATGGFPAAATGPPGWDGATFVLTLLVAGGAAGRMGAVVGAATTAWGVFAGGGCGCCFWGWPGGGGAGDPGVVFWPSIFLHFMECPIQQGGVPVVKAGGAGGGWKVFNSTRKTWCL